MSLSVSNSEGAIKIHCFTGAVNFVEFCNGFDWGQFAPLIKPLQENLKTYQSACCNKNTWFKILETLYADFIANNAQNTVLWNNIKEKTATEKLMMLNSKGEILLSI